MTYIECYDVFVLQGIDDLSESDKLTMAQFIMHKEFKTEVYRDLEK